MPETIDMGAFRGVTVSLYKSTFACLLTCLLKKSKKTRTEKEILTYTRTTVEILSDEEGQYTPVLD